MKIKRNEHNAMIGPSGVRQGFSLNDTYRLRKYDNPLSNPPTQIISAEELEPEPEQRQYWCAECKSPLSYLRASNTIWRCDECLSYYDLNIQDSPIRDKGPFKLVPYQQHYPSADDDSFFEAIDLNKENEPETSIQRHKKEFKSMSYTELIDLVTAYGEFMKSRRGTKV